jgi:FkbM family methyltransferase
VSLSCWSVVGFGMSGMARRVAGRLLDIVDPGNRVRKFRDYYFRDKWLNDVKAIVHVGANIGQEAAHYAERGLRVLWIEPIPSVFLDLKSNIKPYPMQVAYEALLADETGKTVKLHLASNNGASSSIFEMGKGLNETWPEIEYVDHLDLKTLTLDDVLAKDQLVYDGMVLDTQGSELLVLRGARSSLQNFKYIKTEAVDFELYKGACTERDLIEFLGTRGFRVLRRDIFARTPDGSGECSDLLFRQCGI